MKKKQSNAPRREEAEEKKEHFIHIGPKLEAAREFSSLNLNCCQAGAAKLMTLR